MKQNYQTELVRPLDPVRLKTAGARVAQSVYANHDPETDFKAFIERNKTRMTALHELGQYWVGEYFDSLGLWVAIDTPQCLEHYPRIWDWLDANNLNGCCRAYPPERIGDFARYCSDLAGIEAERFFLAEHGYQGVVPRRWRKQYDTARAIVLRAAVGDQFRLAANPVSVTGSPSGRLPL